MLRLGEVVAHHQVDDSLHLLSAVPLLGIKPVIRVEILGQVAFLLILQSRNGIHILLLSDSITIRFRQFLQRLLALLPLVGIGDFLSFLVHPN